VYPSVLYDTIYAAHRGRFERALDLGAGSGQVTRILADRFSEKVYAADPSEGMLEKGKADIGTQYDKIEWHTSSAEDLSWLEDESIDLVTAGIAQDLLLCLSLLTRLFLLRTSCALV
jgi:trans-aconitate 3-methyltransferase